MTKDQAFDGLHAKLESKLVGFDPTIIVAIIAAVMQLLGGCMKQGVNTPAGIKSNCKKRPVRTRVAVNLALQKQGIRPLSTEGQKAAAAVLDVGQEATDDEVAGFLACCGDEE